MKEYLTKIKTIFTTLLDTVNKSPYAILIYIGIFTVLISALMLSSSTDDNATKPMSMDMQMDMQMAKHSITYGPGDGYHIHKMIDPNDFKQIKDISKQATDIPGPLNRNHSETIEINLVATEVMSDLAPATSFHYWTFNDTVPGPFVRVRVGDTIKLSLYNDKNSSHDHSIDLHAVTGPGGGAALTEVEPGETKTMQFKALNPGLFIYHCAAGNAPTHIANGMYGLILVEPETGLPAVDKEFYVMQGEFYTKGLLGERGFQAFDGQKMIEERPEYIVFNGRVSSFVDNDGIKANVGDNVRIYIGNGGVAKIASFHIIGEIFDKVYPEASTSQPLENVQTTLIPAGGASMVELKLNVPGNYVLVDHALARVDRGAWGLLNVSGEKDDTIYSAIGTGSGAATKAKLKKVKPSMNMNMNMNMDMN